MLNKLFQNWSKKCLQLESMYSTKPFFSSLIAQSTEVDLKKFIMTTNFHLIKQKKIINPFNYKKKPIELLCYPIFHCYFCH